MQLPNPTAIETQAARGAGWGVGMGFVTRGVGLVGSLLLTHYVSPEQAGEAIAAAVAVFTANMLMIPSTSSYLVAHPRATKSEGFHVTVLHLTVGLLVLGGLILLAPFLTEFFKAPHLPSLIGWTGIAVLCDRMRNVPEGLLQRDMRFRALNLLRAAGDVAYTLTAILLAKRGFGGYSIVFANMVRYPLSLVGAALLAPRAAWLTPGRLSLATVKRIYGWSVPVSIGQVGEFASRQWDNLAVSHYYGGAIVGAYEKAHSLAELPSAQIAQPMSETLLPAFSRLEGQERRTALLRAVGLIGLLVFPLLIGLSIVGQTAVNALMGSDWHDVGPMITIMCAVTILRPFADVIVAYLQATEGQIRLMWLGFIRVALLFGAVLTVARLSPLWACTVIGIEFGGVAIIGFALIGRRDGLTVRRLASRIVPPLAACLPMIPAVLATRWILLRIGLHAAGLGLVAEIATGALVFILSARLVAGAHVRELLALTREAIRRHRQPESQGLRDLTPIRETAR